MYNTDPSCSTAVSTGYASRRSSGYKSLEQLFRVLLFSKVSTQHIILEKFWKWLPPPPYYFALEPYASSRGNQNLSGLSSEVLKLRLQALNLPITESKGQLFNCLKRTLPGKVARLTTVQPKWVSKAKVRKGCPATRTTTVTERSSEMYSGVSKLTFHYFCPTHYTSPRPLNFSSVWTTRPQAPWVLRLPWSERKNR